MDKKQFFTNCRYCGRQILMVRNTDTGRFTPCDPLIGKYIPNPDGVQYINEGGKANYGFISDHMGAEFGYTKHYATCKARGHN